MYKIVKVNFLILSLLFNSTCLLFSINVKAESSVELHISTTPHQSELVPLSSNPNEAASDPLESGRGANHIVNIDLYASTLCNNTALSIDTLFLWFEPRADKQSNQKDSLYPGHCVSVYSYGKLPAVVWDDDSFLLYQQTYRKLEYSNQEFYMLPGTSRIGLRGGGNLLTD